MSREQVLYRVGAKVATLTINRPERRNALSLVAIAGLRAGLARAKADRGVAAVVLTGAGERAFCAGADLAEMAGGSPASGLIGAHLASLFVDLWELGKPTVARVRGYAVAGGFGLAVACDLVLASDDAVFATPELDMGLWPHVITVPLTRAMPAKKALELMLTGRPVGAEEAQSIGFVTKVVPAARLDAEVEQLTAGLASRPPEVVRAGRDGFYHVWDQPAPAALERLQALLASELSSGEAREAIAGFLQRRPSPGGTPAS